MNTLWFIIDKVNSKLNGWMASKLFMVGRITLAIATLLVIPNYFMQLLEIACGICDKIEQIALRFVWGGSNNNSKIALDRPPGVGITGICTLAPPEDRPTWCWNKPESARLAPPLMSFVKTPGMTGIQSGTLTGVSMVLSTPEVESSPPWSRKLTRMVRLIPRTMVAVSGGVIRDSAGSWKLGYVRNIGQCSALHAELWAIRDGLDLQWS
ncbi:hypothetical protein F3Y22_tig00117012pilonHSYRG00153 [Hibiscus syriacus]|uniref:RNase H type-1 domain-containing protein n=1 Tax=Hibiscus syriacus TaxID=106335 RepID=A0A6A2WCN7_HIBSY|nr:hypothetical protein F3Y22_tig00117012pilonHSYRG00153 [Hibiscus syriacus]